MKQQIGRRWKRKMESQNKCHESSYESSCEKGRKDKGNNKNSWERNEGTIQGNFLFLRKRERKWDNQVTQVAVCPAGREERRQSSRQLALKL